MLEELFINNIGGIFSSKINPKGNFIVITGESGAGKSSIVRAIELLAGKRAQTSFIRYGEENASLTAVIHSKSYCFIPDGVKPDNGQMIVNREIFRNGRSKCYIQDKLFSLTSLSRFMSDQVHIQSQFAQLDLLDPSRQLNLVDSCGGEELIRSVCNVKTFFRKAYDSEKEARQIRMKQKDLSTRFQNAETIINILKRIDLDKDSEITWQKEIEELQFKIKQKKKHTQALLTFKGTEAQPGLVDQFEEYLPYLAELVPEHQKKQTSDLIEDTIDKIFELMKLVESNMSPVSLKEMEDTLEITEQKAGLLRKAKRLANAQNQEDLFAYYEEASSALKWITNSHDILASAEEKSREYRRLASEEAMKLRALRKLAATELETRVNWQMKDLAMLGMSFEIRLKELGKLRETGADDIEFVLRTTDGFSGAVTKVASGGELSRLLLSIQLSLPEGQFPETLVFDEVEAGLGGRAAILAGQKLKELSSKCQVILITHEASIAALADQHYVVRRNVDKTDVFDLEPEERVPELARMLSGDYSLEEAQQHARRLLSVNSLSPAGKN